MLAGPDLLVIFGIALIVLGFQKVLRRIHGRSESLRQEGEDYVGENHYRSGGQERKGSGFC